MYDIKALRIQSSLTQKQLAEKIGVHQTAVSQWELGLAQPRASIIPKLLEALNCKIGDIYTDTSSDFLGEKKGAAHE